MRTPVRLIGALAIIELIFSPSGHKSRLVVLPAAGSSSVTAPAAFMPGIDSKDWDGRGDNPLPSRSQQSESFWMFKCFELRDREESTSNRGAYVRKDELLCQNLS